MGHEFNFEVVPIAEMMEQTEPDAPIVDRLPDVLVVDDEPLIADSLAAILESAGLTVLKAYDGRSALELAIARPPQLLVTDVAMPGMNGIDLAMAVAEAIPTCQVLLFSAHASILDLKGARARGYDFALLSKPIHPREMLRRVSDTLMHQPMRHGRPQRAYSDANHAPMWQLPQVNA